jgi:putative CocE/NonD family hydrolase
MVAENAYPVRVVKDVRIPMPDGVHLAANLFLPDADGRYPALFAFTPYHKDGRGGLDHEAHHRYFASHGYACMQIDFRGTGNSEGINPHPMNPQERQDGHDAVEWIAAQPWCSGSVGVWGISYGGITSLSIASTRPPHLRAIVPIHATVDNREWLFRPHGCQGLLLCDVDWGTRMVAANLSPPFFEDPEGRWMRLWRARLEGNTPWFMHWHGAPPDADYWLRRRIPYEQIDVPTFGICGWYDAYTAPTFLVYEAVRAPKRVLIGPWKHALPDLSPDRPAGGAREMLRWWDRWLKGVENGVDREPPVAIYVLGAETWRYEERWPIERAATSRFYLAADHALSRRAGDDLAAPDEYAYDPRVGTGSIGYNGHRKFLPLPDDQSADDHRSLSYTTVPLEAAIEITGEPLARIWVSATSEETNVVAKLCVVDRDGRSQVISAGVANTARVDGHAPRTPLGADEVREIAVRMHPVSIVVPRGRRLRLCVAGADFPEIWPTPKAFTMRVHRAGRHTSLLDLPVVPPGAGPLVTPRLEPPRTDLGPVGLIDSRESHVVHERYDARTRSFETTRVDSSRIDDRTTLATTHRALVTTDADRPWGTHLETETAMTLERPMNTVTTRVRTLVTSFSVDVHAEVDLDGQPYFRKNWHKDIHEWEEC